MGWASREIAPTPATPLCTPPPPRPRSPAIGIPTTTTTTTPHKPSAPKPQTPSCLSFFYFFFFSRSVAHGAEKIVFITCQHLAALSYATQDSIKLSYTGMKLQNRPGTPQQNYFIFFLPPAPPNKKINKKKDGGCLAVR